MWQLVKADSPVAKVKCEKTPAGLIFLRPVSPSRLCEKALRPGSLFWKKLSFKEIAKPFTFKTPKRTFLSTTAQQPGSQMSMPLFTL